MATTITQISEIEAILGDDARARCWNISCKTIPKENLHLPGPDFVDRICTPCPIARRAC